MSAEGSSASRLDDLAAVLPPSSTPPGTKGRVLTSALRAFADRGFYGTSIRTIAAGAGINSATLYSHYASKEEILAALVTMGSRELLARIEDALLGLHEPADKLDAMVRTTAMAHATFPLLAIVSNNERHALSAELLVGAWEASLQSSALLHAVLEEGRVGGVFSEADVEVSTHVLEGMAQQIPRWISRASLSPDQVGDAYVSIARRIVGIS
jgi:AcrR family transcriptional regulator